MKSLLHATNSKAYKHVQKQHRLQDTNARNNVHGAMRSIPPWRPEEHTVHTCSSPNTRCKYGACVLQLFRSTFANFPEGRFARFARNA